MAANTEPRSGLFYGWALGENNWKDGMDANLLRIGRFGFHLSVKDRDLTTPPTTPAAGDTYIAAATSTGAWTGKDGQIAVWSGTEWVFATPRSGWKAFIEDEQVMSVYNGTSWPIGKVNNAHSSIVMSADSNKTLSSIEAAAEIYDITSSLSLTATRNVVVPLLRRQFTVYNGTTGAQSIQIIAPSGTGITIANGKRAILYCNGTNVVRVTPDA